MVASGFRRVGKFIAITLLLASARSGHVLGQEKIRSLQYVWVHPMTTKSGEPAECVRTFMILDGHLMREHFEARKVAADGEGQQEVLNSFDVIHDAAAGKKIVLDPGKKVCTIVKQELRTTNKQGPHWVKIEPQPEMDFCKHLRLRVPSDARQLPETAIDVRRAIGFVEVDVRGPKSSTTTWWVDPETKVPFKMEHTFRTTEPDQEAIHSVWRDIVVDAPLDRSLFSTDPPAGYSVVVQNGEN